MEWSTSYPHSDCRALAPDKPAFPRRADGPLETRGQSANFVTPSQSNSPKHARSLLIQIIEGEIIPRLFLAHRDVKSQQNFLPENVGEGDLRDGEFLAKLFLTGNDADIVCRLEALMKGGVGREVVYLEVLASVPRALVVFWEKGHCSFDNVSQGLHCLDQVMWEMHQRERDIRQSV